MEGGAAFDDSDGEDKKVSEKFEASPNRNPACSRLIKFQMDVSYKICKIYLKVLKDTQICPEEILYQINKPGL